MGSLVDGSMRLIREIRAGAMKIKSRDEEHQCDS